MFAQRNLLGLLAIVVALQAHANVLAQPTAPVATASVQFRPLTDADVQGSLAQVKAAAAAVDRRFAAAGASADGWKEYLSWPAFAAELPKVTPDRAILSGVYNKLAAGHEGLELRSFAELRAALGNYLAVASSVGNADLQAAVNSHAEDLAKELQAQEAAIAVDSHRTTDDYSKVADHVLWLEMARQTPGLVKHARSIYSSPNFAVRIGKDIVDLGVGRPVDQVAPIDDVILGTVVHGTGRTVGETRGVLNADPATASQFATFDAVLQAVNSSNNVGRNGPVCIYTTGQTSLAAAKRFWIDADGIHVLPTVASAQTSTTINNIVSIKGRRMVENIAWRRAGKQKGQAEAIAGQHAAARVAAQVDAQANPTVNEAEQRYQTKLRGPLDERRAFPQSLKFSTLPAALAIDGTVVAQSQLAAPSAPPQLASLADGSRAGSLITLCVHESAINNLAENVLTGMRLNDEMVEQLAVQITGSVPEKLKRDQSQEPFTIVFPAERIPRAQPITISFADNGFSITLRGREYYTGDRQQPGMDITANYKFEKTPDGYKAVRQGDLLIYGFGQKPGTKRSLRQEGIYTALQAKFGKVFEPEIKFKGFKFAQGQLAAAGQFVPQEIIAQNGWLAVAYARVQLAGEKVAKD